MKTTIDIADPILEQARRLAAQRGTTVKALVELGLRRVVEESTLTGGFRLRSVVFHGDGLQPELEGASWEQIRELAYGDRGVKA